MGKLVEGRWLTDDQAEDRVRSGRWQREASVVRNWVTPDGAPGPSGEGRFPAEPGRYHLYIAINCPWAHRAWLMRALKGLDDAIGLSIAAPRRTDQGWVFTGGRFADTLLGKATLHEVYTNGMPDYTGRATTPLLYDAKVDRLVSNESAEIIRMLNSAFAGTAGNDANFYPPALRAEIDEVNERVYRGLNNGVYRAGFAREQAAYDEAVDEVFETLDWLEDRLASRRFLMGNDPTEADVRLFPTLARFDAAYWTAFKCNKRRLIDYPALTRYARRFHDLAGVTATVDTELYKRGYFSPSAARNPHGIVPGGPAEDFISLDGG